MIGEAFENSDDVCGAVVNIRGKGDKIGNYISHYILPFFMSFQINFHLIILICVIKLNFNSYIL